MNIKGKEPKTKKGQIMKEKIIAAGKKAFSENGYFATRIIDITNNAGISEGNFYRYFNNKEEVLTIVITDMLQELYIAGRSGDLKGNFYEKLIQSTKRMLNVYKKNADMYKVLLQVIHYDDQFYQLWEEMRSSFIRRIRKELNKQDFPPHVDLDYVASALGSMVSNFAYIWCVLDGVDDIDKEFDIDVAATTLAYLWCKGIDFQLNEENNS